MPFLESECKGSTFLFNFQEIDEKNVNDNIKASVNQFSLSFGEGWGGATNLLKWIPTLCFQLKFAAVTADENLTQTFFGNVSYNFYILYLVDSVVV